MSTYRPFRPVSTETIALIALLAPNLTTFRVAQLVHSAFRATPTGQFVIRCCHRHLQHINSNAFTEIGWVLPNNHEDGLSVRQYDDEYSYTCHINGRKHGKSSSYNMAGQILELQTFAHGELHGACKVWYPHGQIRYERAYVDGKMHGEQLNWRSDGTLHSLYKFVNGYQES